MPSNARLVTVEDRTACTPVHVVWELTLACDLKCQHCGSRAGRRRPEELSTAECLDLIQQLAGLGARHVTLIGGEAYLRRDWIEIIRAIRAAGMDCTLQTGGLHLSKALITKAVKAGLQGIGVSIDGLADLHDRLRGVKGSFDAAFSVIRQARAQKLSISTNTQITSLIVPQLRKLMRRLIKAGVEHWQLQLTVAMGRAADNPEILLQPYELLEVMPLLADLYKEGVKKGILIQPANNIGYFGPYESLWRGNGDDRVHWVSCNAGQNTIGIEADGTIKGCPSLPTSPYSGGNIRDLSLRDIWQSSPEVGFTRKRTTDDLWGFCRSCYYADICRGGCTWTAHVLFGRAGNNPYCHHRTLELARQGLRERVVRVAPAPGRPFDHGHFDLVVEPLSEDAPSTGPMLTASSNNVSGLVSIQPLPRRTRLAPPLLVVCRGCHRHVALDAVFCPHCGGDVGALAREYKKKLRVARQAQDDLLKELGV